MKRSSLKKSCLVLLFATFFFWGVLSGSLVAGEKKYPDHPVPNSCMAQVEKEGKVLYIYDWAEWWPEELFENFTKEFGIKIVRDHYANTEEMATKFRLNKKTPYDLVLGAGPSAIIQLRPLGVIRKLDHEWLPNVDAYMMDEYKNMAFDPGNNYQLPDSAFMTTYTYNSKFVDENDPKVGSWKLLFEGDEYAGKITMIDNMYETIGTALMYLGYSYNSDNEAELMEARDVLLKQKPKLMAYDSWPRRSLIEEESYISHLWTGDGWLLSQDAPTMRGVLPEEGGYVATNTDFIPIGGKHPAAAHLFLNYLFRTDVNSMLVEWIGYPPVHKHVMEFMSPEMKAWPGFIFPDGYIEKCSGVEERAFIGKGKELRIKIWEEIKQ
ncbi:MAG: spermidine/putrescine ABC transporter substrate-binding protein [Desulfobacterales bacterium]|nr:spermidine/putrescine ABC transporter substrate-binding protein [Desulfobacterales bacterium]